ncbi:MAG: hypothetical protein ACE5DN_00480 [Flavobacteriales bacterium]
MNSNQLPVSGGVAIFIAVIISYFVYSPEDLSGVRPDESRAIEQVHGSQDVQARLWQDPFAAAAGHKHAREKDVAQIRMTGKVVIPPLNKRKPTTARVDIKPSKESDINTPLENTPHSFNKLTEQIANEFEESKKPVNILSVMVSAGPYPEDEERRLRRRYAVIAGLAASGYQPEDAAHIGYVDDLPEAYCLGNHQDDSLLPAIMPYEWFKNDEEDSYFLLLWLDEDAFTRHPLCKLDFLLGKIKTRAGKQDTTAIGKLRIIGPSRSGTLKAMIKDLSNEDGPAVFPNLKNNAQIFSAMATAQDNQLTSDASWHEVDSGLDMVEQKFKKHDIPLFRTIANDGGLAEVMVEELNKRIFDISDDKKIENFQIALVSEWDTLYGRTLPDAFADKIRELAWKEQSTEFDNFLAKVLFNQDSHTRLKQKQDQRKMAKRKWEQALISWKRAKAKWIEAQNNSEDAKEWRDAVSGVKDAEKKRLAAEKKEAAEEWKSAEEKWKAAKKKLKNIEETWEPAKAMRGAKNDWKQAQQDWGDAKREWEKEHIYRFSYLRGIDGKIAGGAKQNKSGNKGEKQKAESNTLIDRPAGKSQRDYLRRLANDMQLKDQQLKNEGRKGIRAIGILGSDVYDKLMVLRVLRQRFPKAIFFTTDLDASLLHPAEFRWTRNMLVASSFNLKIADYKELQRIKEEASNHLADILMNATKATIPQFRDVYQTSVYISTLWATNEDLGAGSAKNAKLIKQAIKAIAKENAAAANEAAEKAKAVANEAAEKAKAAAKEAADEAEEIVTKIKQENQAMEDANKAAEKAKAAAKEAADEAEAIVYNIKQENQAMEDANKAAENAKAAAKEAAEKAAVAAAERGMLESNELARLIKRNLAPKVYEIGRNGAVELPDRVFNPREGDVCVFAMENIQILWNTLTSKGMLGSSPFYPASAATVSPRSIIIVFVCLMLFGALAFAFWCRWVVSADLGSVGRKGDMNDRLYIHELDKARWMTGVALFILWLIDLFKVPMSIAAVGAFVVYILLAVCYCRWARNIMETKIIVVATLAIKAALAAVAEATIAMKEKETAAAKAKAAINVVANTGTIEEAKIEAAEKEAVAAQDIAEKARVIAEAKIEAAAEAVEKARIAVKAKSAVMQKYSHGIPERLNVAERRYFEEGEVNGFKNQSR